jgi:hypothetical protein
MMGELLDNPNQQVVRPDGSGPADEGTGAGKPKKAKKDDAKATSPPADTPEEPS